MFGKKIFSGFRWMTLVLFAFVFLAMSSCEVGLGEAVDTEVPELHITQPTNDYAPIRGAFILKGTCADDGTISRIEVTIQGLDSEKNDSITKKYEYNLNNRGGVTLFP